MKIANMKAVVVKGLTIGLLAGAVALAAPAKADAQQFSVGVQVGYPHNGYIGRDHYDRLRFEQLRHEEWVRAHQYDRYHHGYRGRW